MLYFCWCNPLFGRRCFWSTSNELRVSLFLCHNLNLTLAGKKCIARPRHSTPGWKTAPGHWGKVTPMFPERLHRMYTHAAWHETSRQSCRSECSNSLFSPAWTPFLIHQFPNLLWTLVCAWKSSAGGVVDRSVAFKQTIRAIGFVAAALLLLWSMESYLDSIWLRFKGGCCCSRFASVSGPLLTFFSWITVLNVTSFENASVFASFPSTAAFVDEVKPQGVPPHRKLMSPWIRACVKFWSWKRIIGESNLQRKQCDQNGKTNRAKACKVLIKRSSRRL